MSKQNYTQVVAPSVAELDSAARIDDVEHWRMTGAQYAELCSVAARAELSAARRRGLHLPREVYAEVLPEMCSAAAVAGLERAANVDASAGYTLSDEQRAQLRRTSAGPRWAACYTSHRAPAGSPVEWAQLSATERAQLMRARWVAWLRNAVRRELDARAELHAAESGEPSALEQSAEEMRAARQSTGEQLAAQLSARLSRAGSPLGALELHAVTAALAPMTHAQRAELLGTTAEACKTYAAKGRAGLRRRFPSVAAFRAELRAADVAADRAEMYAAAIRRAPAGYLTSAEAAESTRRALERAERAQRAEQSRGDTSRNVEHWRAGHAGGVIREVPTSATPEDGTGQLSRPESAARGHVGYVVHRAPSVAPYRRDRLIMAGLSHRARVDRVQRAQRRESARRLRAWRIARAQRAEQLAAQERAAWRAGLV